MKTLSQDNKKSQEVAGIKVVFPIFIRECKIILQEIKGGRYGEYSYYYFGRVASAAIKEGLLAAGITSADAFRDYLFNVLGPEEEIPFWCDVVLAGAAEACRVDWGLSGNSQ